MKGYSLFVLKNRLKKKKVEVKKKIIFLKYCLEVIKF